MLAPCSWCATFYTNAARVLRRVRDVYQEFAVKVFRKADNQDRAGRANVDTAKTYYAASIFMEVGHDVCGPTIMPPTTHTWRLFLLRQRCRDRPVFMCLLFRGIRQGLIKGFEGLPSHIRSFLETVARWIFTVSWLCLRVRLGAVRT